MTGDERAGAYVETYTGHGFYPFDPDPADVRLADVAGGLAQTCRFGGHCREFYSVAQHSLHVSRDLAAAGYGSRVQLYGLLHDAGEAYVGDVARPIKGEFPAFERAEERILDAVWTAFALPPPDDEDWAAVMAADDRLLAYEADRLLADGSWADEPPDVDYDLTRDSIAAVRERFAERAEELLGEC